ncbi:7,8-didemethyl-8-hydroxy-5-deazariboflavin synthase, partial [Rhodococcus wratislaviensis]
MLPHPAGATALGRADTGPRQIPTPSAMRRVLRRARDGATLNVDEATTLLQARGGDLADLCSSAAKVRDAGLLAAGRPRAVTYSRKVFIP